MEDTFNNTSYAENKKTQSEGIDLTPHWAFLYPKVLIKVVGFSPTCLEVEVSPRSWD
jgi:hypothetical protein